MGERPSFGCNTGVEEAGGQNICRQIGVCQTDSEVRNAPDEESAIRALGKGMLNKCTQLEDATDTFEERFYPNEGSTT